MTEQDAWLAAALHAVAGAGQSLQLYFADLSVLEQLRPQIAAVADTFVAVAKERGLLSDEPAPSPPVLNPAIVKLLTSMSSWARMLTGANWPAERIVLGVNPPLTAGDLHAAAAASAKPFI